MSTLMRNRILGGIGVLWGGALLVDKFVMGHDAAVIFGFAMFLAGGYYLLKGSAAKAG